MGEKRTCARKEEERGVKRKEKKKRGFLDVPIVTRHKILDVSPLAHQEISGVVGLRLLDILCGVVGLLRMPGACVGGRFKKEV
jgi:hypothetical protein